MTASASSRRWLAKPFVPYPRRSVVASAADAPGRGSGTLMSGRPSGQPAAQRRGRRDGHPEQTGSTRVR